MNVNRHLKISLNVYGTDQADKDDNEVAFIWHECRKENDRDNEPFVLSEEDEVDE